MPNEHSRERPLELYLVLVLVANDAHTVQSVSALQEKLQVTLLLYRGIKDHCKLRHLAKLADRVESKILLQEMRDHH